MWKERCEAMDGGFGGRILDFGGKLGLWKGKCLGNAILALCRGSMWERVRKVFARRCGNHVGAGYGGTVREAQNMDAVVEVLKRESVAVRVFSAEGLDAWRAGRYAGFWMLGLEHGECLGSLLWCKGHVYVLRGEVSSGGSGVCTDAVPWVCSVVRAPKRRVKASAQQLVGARRARWTGGGPVEAGGVGVGG